MQLERARSQDHDAIYLMGYDAWGNGEELEGYLRGCRESRKYAQGRWFVLRCETKIRSSALVHDFGAAGGRPVLGIGSVATGTADRRQGYGAALVERLTDQLLQQEQAAAVFLYADIAPEFYERLGFGRVEHHFQRFLPSVLMARFGAGLSPEWLNTHYRRVPGYF